MGDTPPQQTSPALTLEHPTNTGDDCEAESENFLYETECWDGNRTLAAWQNTVSKWQNCQQEVWPVFSASCQEKQRPNETYLHRLLGHFSLSPTQFYTSLSKPLVCRAALLSGQTREKKKGGRREDRHVTRRGLYQKYFKFIHFIRLIYWVL
jgi:hypothetical protein